MGKISAGLLMYRFRKGTLAVLLVHPGGPFWAKKDQGAWSIPKGEPASGEELLSAAKREFQEETGCKADGNFAPLAPLRQSSGKMIHAWALEGDFDPAALKSNLFSMEWPPGSGKQQQFPEIDRAAWFDLSQAKEKIVSGQKGFLEEVETRFRRS